MAGQYVEDNPDTLVDRPMEICAAAISKMEPASFE